MKKIKALFSVLLCLMMICGYSVNYVSANDTEIVNETSDDTTIEEANNEKEEDVETENTETTKTEEETPKTTAASTKEVPSAKAAGVTVNTTSATLVDMSSVTGDIEIKSDGLYVGGTSVGETTLNPNGYEFSGTTTTNNITVSKDVEAILYLNNLNMTISKAGGCINVSHSNTTIILRNGSVNNLINKLNIGIWGFGYAAIYKNGSDGNLTITCDRQIAEGSSYRITNNSGALNTTDGTLNVSSTGVHQSGIGSSYHGTRGIYDEDNSFANLYVKGGLIYAKGGIHGSGIGSGCGVYLQTGGKSTAKNMNFSGGYIEAYANGGGAGIGGGHSTPVDGLYFSNGVQVVAYGASYSPGIGSGGNGDDYVASESSNATGRYDVKNLVISGGETKVTAYGDKNSNTPGIGSGHVNPGFNSADHKGVLSNVTATPETNYQGYVKYGTSDTDYSYSTANPKTPFPTSEEFGTYLQNEAADGNPVYYTQVYFGPYKDNNDIDENAE
ncbi:MAG: hypothetical protein PHH04_08725, partial [Thomasclavelia sp.]|nr:hypothetical protein [Thomasclavelia sp.]